MTYSRTRTCLRLCSSSVSSTSNVPCDGDDDLPAIAINDDDGNACPINAPIVPARE